MAWRVVFYISHEHKIIQNEKDWQEQTNKQHNNYSTSQFCQYLKKLQTLQSQQSYTAFFVGNPLTHPPTKLLKFKVKQTLFQIHLNQIRIIFTRFYSSKNHPWKKKYHHQSSHKNPLNLPLEINVLRKKINMLISLVSASVHADMWPRNWALQKKPLSTQNHGTLSKL